MSSPTLAKILKHWTVGRPEGEAVFDPDVVRLPFDIEAFCREMDELLLYCSNDLNAELLLHLKAYRDFLEYSADDYKSTAKAINAIIAKAEAMK